MREHDNILSVASLGPNYLGFIFYSKSPRFVGDNFTIPESMPLFTKRVGVFVNESKAAIMDKVKSIGLDFIQLHGDETADACRELKETGVGIIKAFSIDDKFDFREVSPYKTSADYFLFDTKGTLYGGNGKIFDWDVLKRYDQEIPFFLSGGLSPENVDGLGDILNMNLHALDFNSGVELLPGFKSPEKVKAAISLVNGT